MNKPDKDKIEKDKEWIPKITYVDMGIIRIRHDVIEFLFSFFYFYFFILYIFNFNFIGLAILFVIMIVAISIDEILPQGEVEMPKQERVMSERKSLIFHSDQIDATFHFKYFSIHVNKLRKLAVATLLTAVIGFLIFVVVNSEIGRILCYTLIYIEFWIYVYIDTYVDVTIHP